MENLTLKVCTPEGVLFDDQIISVNARTVVGDVQILKNHANYATAIEKGNVVIKTKTEEIIGVCGGGFLSVNENEVRIITDKFEKE